MDEYNQILQIVAVNNINHNNIFNYLNTVIYNPFQSTLNQAMIFIQSPDKTMKYVCGKKAWLNQNRTINSNSKPIVIYVPSLQLDTDKNIYKTDFIPVNAFDIDSTEGDDLIINNSNIDFEQVLTEITNISPKPVSASELGIHKYQYNPEEHTMYILNTALEDKELYNSLILSLLVDYTLDSYNINNKILKYALLYILYERYSIKHSISDILFIPLDNFSIEHKIDFLYLIHFFTEGLIQDIEGSCFSFDEIAYINLLNLKDNEILWVNIINIIEHIDNDVIRSELQILLQKLQRSSINLKEICDLQYQNRIFSFPPFIINTDKTDYLYNQRKEYLSYFSS